MIGYWFLAKDRDENDVKQDISITSVPIEDVERDLGHFTMA